MSTRTAIFACISRTVRPNRQAAVLPVVFTLLTLCNLVHEVMQDYPRTADESDWLRLFRFVPNQEEIHVFTYSPAQDRLCGGMRHVSAWNDHQFVLDVSDALSRHAQHSSTRDVQPSAPAIR